MRNGKLFIFLLAVMATGCDRIFIGNFDTFASTFGGEYKGEYYTTKSGETIYFNSLNTPTLIIGGGVDEIKVMVGDSLAEKLVNVLSDRNKKLQRKDILIQYGTDISGNKKSIRLTAVDPDPDSDILMFTSNFILGDYNSSKDTVDIYYSRL